MVIGQLGDASIGAHHHGWHRGRSISEPGEYHRVLERIAAFREDVSSGLPVARAEDSANESSADRLPRQPGYDEAPATAC
jgi:hypothetical protein